MIKSYWYFFLSIVIALVLRYYLRRPSKQESKPQLDLYQTAYLAGGDQRVIESAIVKLVHQGYLRPNVRNRTFAIAKALAQEANHLEHQIMYKVRRTPEFKELKKVDEYEINDLRRQLEQANLLIEQNLHIAVGYAIILFFGVLLGGLFSETLSENQIRSFLCGSFFMVACLIIPGSRTRWGDFVLSDIKHHHNSFDAVQRFALYGEVGLSGGVLDDVKQIYKEQKEADTGGCGCGC
ncbi:MAG: TIGR04222 domain-containing membrane protein [Pleurocapsa sp.]